MAEIDHIQNIIYFLFSLCNVRLMLNDGNLLKNGSFYRLSQFVGIVFFFGEALSFMHPVQPKKSLKRDA